MAHTVVDDIHELQFFALATGGRVILADGHCLGFLFSVRGPEHRKRKFHTDLIVALPQFLKLLLCHVQFLSRVEVDGVDEKVGMNVFPVCMGADQDLISLIVLSQLQCRRMSGEDVDKRQHMHTVMLLGTSSSVGKSTVSSILCRYFTNKGLKTVPFKALNLASKSTVLPDGLEIGTGQAIQAIACRTMPDARMNPILLKPKKNRTTCYICGKIFSSYPSYRYPEENRKLQAYALNAYRELTAEADVAVLEGSGSCCELNLLSSDIANLFIARETKSPCILVADIEKGGVFGAIYGTLSLLPPEDRKRFKGIIINKFHGDPSFFADGAIQIERLTKLPVLGVLPFLSTGLPDEDGIYAENLLFNAMPVRAIHSRLDFLLQVFEKYLDLLKISQIAGFCQ